jgi:dihydroorotase
MEVVFDCCLIIFAIRNVVYKIFEKLNFYLVKCLIKKVKVIDVKSKYHGRQVDILIMNSKIEEIKSSINPIQGIKVISGEDLHCSISWLDIGSHIGEPGLEHRETIESVIASAIKGGYGAIAAFPNTVPVVQSKTSVKYLTDKAFENKYKIYPIGALSENTEGKEITEMIDLHHAGVIAFSDGLKSVQNAGLLARALDYVKPFDGLIINHSYDKTLCTDAQMHEGEMSTMLGMKGAPYLSETMMIKRDIDLLQYCNSKLCSYGISAAESVKLVKEAKKSGANLSCTVPYLNLIKTDHDLSGFDSSLKIQPPLRKKSDLSELVKGLKDDTIDAIVSNHYPIEEEGKKLEFTYAKFGASGIETVFSALNTFCPQLDLETLIYKLSYGPRDILNIKSTGIQVGETADLTLFSPSIEWKFDFTNSKSKNNPFLGSHFRGKVIDVIN